MPKVPGKTSTRKTVKIDGLMMGSFVMPHETHLDKRTCVIRGCDHKIGPTMEQIREGTWSSCDKDHLPGFAARQVGPREFDNVGVVCPCHVAVILRGESGT